MVYFVFQKVLWSLLKQLKWHMRLAHMSGNDMVILSKRGLLDNHKVASLDFCEYCVIETHDYLHVDCWVPSRVPPLGGARYFLSIIDDFSRMMSVFMMKHKCEAFEKFKHWRFLLRTKLEGKSGIFVLIMVWNFVQESLLTSAEMKELQGIIWFITLLNKTG
ncbi:retrovirus-related pol polyprotein from transposon TNT 1-94 [Tanacetum coccineum]